MVTHIGEHKIQLIPVPDARQYGNTQKMGCSWVVYKVPMNPEWSGKSLQLAVQAYLPETVEAQVEAWVVEQWWRRVPGHSATVAPGMNPHSISWTLPQGDDG